MVKGKKIRSYETDCQPYIDCFKKVTLSKHDIQLLDAFSVEVAEVKVKEHHYLKDDEVVVERYKTGFGGELAVDSFLGISTTDLSIGSSRFHDKSDLVAIDLDCGIKTVDYGKYHVVHKKPMRPEIIVIKNSETEFLICGLATIAVLQKFQDIELIMSAKLRARGTKTGFYGYGHLKQFNNLEELKELL
jgi:hypothetical protein